MRFRARQAVLDGRSTYTIEVRPVGGPASSRTAIRITSPPAVSSAPRSACTTPVAAATASSCATGRCRRTRGRPAARRTPVCSSARSASTCRDGPRVEDVVGVAPPRRAVATAYCMFASPRGRVRVRRADERDPGPHGVADVLGAQVEAEREPVDLQRDVVLERDLEDPVEVERVLGPAVDVAPLGMAEAADVRVGGAPRARGRSSRGRGIRWPPWTLAWTQSSSARTSSGRSSRPSGRMSHSMPRRTRNGASVALAAAISSAWRRTSSAVSPGRRRPRACGRRSRGTRSRGRGPRGPSPRRSRARRTTSCGCAGRRGCRRARAAAAACAVGHRASRSSGGHHGSPSARKTASSSGASGSGRGRRPRRPRRSRATRAVPNRSGRGDDELDRHALDREADRPALLLPTAARRSAAARRTASGRAAGRPRRTRPQGARTSPASVARRRPPSPPSACRDRPDEFARAVEQEPLPRPRLLRAGERFEQPRLGLRPDAARGPQAAGERRVAKLARGPHVERAGELERPLRAQPEVAAEARRGPARARARARRARRSRPSRRARAASPRCSTRSRAARRTRPDAHQVRDRHRRAADRLGGAPVRARAVGVRLGELEAAPRAPPGWSAMRALSTRPVWPSLVRDSVRQSARLWHRGGRRPRPGGPAAPAGSGARTRSPRRAGTQAHGPA